MKEWPQSNYRFLIVQGCLWILCTSFLESPPPSIPHPSLIMGVRRGIKDARSCCLSFSCSLPRVHSLDVSLISGRQKVRASAPQQEPPVFLIVLPSWISFASFCTSLFKFSARFEKNNLWDTLSHEIIEESLSEILGEELVRLKTPAMDPSWSCLKGHFTLKWVIYSPV